jgi:hypothetical protein
MAYPPLPAPFGILAVAILLVAACTNGTSVTASPIASPEASFGPAALACGPMDLRKPNGELIDLTGTWQGGATIHYVRQIGSCVWWIALSDWPDQELGAFYSFTFSGHVSSDFTLQGDFAAILRPNLGGVPISPRGHIKFQIDLPEANSDEPITLRQVDVTEELEGSYIDNTLRYLGPLPLPVRP